MARSRDVGRTAGVKLDDEPARWAAAGSQILDEIDDEMATKLSRAER